MGMTNILVLASSSPRRQEILREAGIPIEVHPAHIREQRLPGEGPLAYVGRLSREKAAAVAAQFPDRYVLGADTIVIVESQILEKPSDAADAKRMLRRLSGRLHVVATAVSLACPGDGIFTRAANTKVFFRHISEQEIEAYVATGEPIDKAGAYAIQGGAGKWVERIEGEYSNVVGLPLSVVKEMLRESGFR
jgi:septum formation protein